MPEKNEDDEDGIIAKYDAEADLVLRFVCGGEDKGETCLMFSLHDADNRSKREEEKLQELYAKFRKSKSPEVRYTIKLLTE